MLCLATLYWANAEAIQTTCKFKLVEAREKIFELAENTWAIYSTGMININQACPAKNTNKPELIKSGHAVLIDPGCYIQTMDHIISADKSEMAEIQMKTTWIGPEN